MIPQRAVTPRGSCRVVLTRAITAISSPMTNQAVMSPRRPARVVEGQAQASPFVIEFFTVQAVGFRCTAYCDENGRWRDAINNEELFGEISILG